MMGVKSLAPLVLAMLRNIIFFGLVQAFNDDPEVGWAVDVGNWVACRDSAVRKITYPEAAMMPLKEAGSILSSVDWTPYSHRRDGFQANNSDIVGDCVLDASVPGTILTSLLRNGTFGSVKPYLSKKTRNRNSASNDDDLAGRVYIDDTLSSIPDINITSGRDFYTFWYRTEIDLLPPVRRLTETVANKGGKRHETTNRTRRPLSLLSSVWLHLRGCNYRVTVFINGQFTRSFEEETSNPNEHAPLDGAGTTDAAAVDGGVPGMFLRRRFRIPISGDSNETKVAVAFLVEPPDHPGFVGSGGQGGDHSLAMDGAVMQSAAGWDWVAPMPDRNTGPWDSVKISVTLKPSASSNSRTNVHHLNTLSAGTTPKEGVQHDTIKSSSGARRDSFQVDDSTTDKNEREEILREGEISERRDVVALEESTGPVFLLSDPAIFTLELVRKDPRSDNAKRGKVKEKNGNDDDGCLCDDNGEDDYAGCPTGAVLEAVVTVSNVATTIRSPTSVLSHVSAAAATATFSVSVALIDNKSNQTLAEGTYYSTVTTPTLRLLRPGSQQEVRIRLAVPPGAGLELWWPHTHLSSSQKKNRHANSEHEAKEDGASLMPKLYHAEFTVFELEDGDNESDGDDGHGKQLSGAETRRMKRTSAHHEQAATPHSSSSLSRTFHGRHHHTLKLKSVGVRTIETYFDETTQGRAFKVNGVRVYLEGGNWITTDAMLRYATNRERYFNEVKLHRSMGLNLIRVWGGGVWERSAGFFEACDALGLLVFQEFWMTGDNNGRWAGSYDWPLNQQAYLSNAADSLLQIRKHPSLMLIGGGNELSPKDLNPSPEVAAGLLALCQRLAPTIPFIMSSMAPQNYSEPFDWNYALAPNDGNYGPNTIGSFYSTRNPGLDDAEEVPISFQPEIGSVSSPSFRSLQQFLSADALAAFPTRDDDLIDSRWVFHKYEAFLTTVTEDGIGDDVDLPWKYDFVYAYDTRATNTTPAAGGAVGANTDASNTTAISDAESWALASSMVQHQQYQAMFEGFALHAFEWYSAMIMWKSQSPWPSLRGFLYDAYLDTTGGFWGVARATSSCSPRGGGIVEPFFTSSIINGGEKGIEDIDELNRHILKKSIRLHVQMSPSSLECAVVNRGRHAITNTTFSTAFNSNTTIIAESAANSHSFSVVLSFFNLSGAQVGLTQFRTVGGGISPQDNQHSNDRFRDGSRGIPANRNVGDSSSSNVKEAVLGNHRFGVVFPPTSSVRCEGGPFEWPMRGSHGYVNGGTLLLELSLLLTPEDEQGKQDTHSNKDRSHRQNIPQKEVGSSNVLASNSYWLTDLESTPGETAAGTGGASTEKGSKRFQDNTTLPAMFPDYRDIAALRLFDPTKADGGRINLVVNGSFALLAKEKRSEGTKRPSEKSVKVEVSVTHPGESSKSKIGRATESLNQSSSMVAFWTCLSLLKPRVAKPSLTLLSSPPLTPDSRRTSDSRSHHLHGLKINKAAEEYIDDGNSVADERVLPTWWENNCVTLLPGQTRTFSALVAASSAALAPSLWFDAESLKEEKAVGSKQPPLRVEVTGWNVATAVIDLTPL